MTRRLYRLRFSVSAYCARPLLRASLRAGSRLCYRPAAVFVTRRLNDRLRLYHLAAYRAVASRRLAVGSAGSRHRAVCDFGMALSLYGLVIDVFAYRAGAGLSARGCAGRLFGDRPFAVLVTRRLNDRLRLDDLAAYRAVASRRLAVGSAGSRHRFVGDYGVSLSF